MSKSVARNFRQTIILPPPPPPAITPVIPTPNSSCEISGPFLARETVLLDSEFNPEKTEYIFTLYGLSENTADPEWIFETTIVPTFGSFSTSETNLFIFIVTTAVLWDDGPSFSVSAVIDGITYGPLEITPHPVA